MPVNRKAFDREDYTHAHTHNTTRTKEHRSMNAERLNTLNTTHNIAHKEKSEASIAKMNAHKERTKEEKRLERATKSLLKKPW